MDKKDFNFIWDKTQDDLKKNGPLIMLISIILAIPATIISIFNYYDLKSKGFNSLHYDIIYIITSSPENSIFLKAVSYLFNLFTYLVLFIVLIYLFKGVSYKMINFSEGFNLLSNKIMPLILMSIIYFIPITMSFLVFYYFLIKKLEIFALISFSLFLALLIFSEYIIFYFYATLFREKMFLESYKYSYFLVKGNFWRTFLMPFYFISKLFFIFILLMIIYRSFTFFKIEALYFFALFILNFSIFWYLYSFMIFLMNYFLILEKEKEINAEIVQNSEDKK